MSFDILYEQAELDTLASICCILRGIGIVEVQEKIRRAVVTAMFADDELYEHLVLKGGNALRLIHDIGGRTSLDLDFSIESDLRELAELIELEQRMCSALEDRLSTVGYVPFDMRLEEKPPEPKGQWGGYEFSFKVISEAKHSAYAQQRTELQRRAEVVSASTQHRTWKVQISKHEYCGGKVIATLDHFAIQVYTPEMIAIEKIRALCQQMPQYEQPIYPRARARDFYDIWKIVTEVSVQLEDLENLKLCELIFSAKNVSLNLIPQIEHHREFHRPDWASVEGTVAEPLEPFDIYFDFVVQETMKLKPLWNK